MMEFIGSGRHAEAMLLKLLARDVARHLLSTGVQVGGTDGALVQSLQSR
jgi:hypothetical protein